MWDLDKIEKLEQNQTALVNMLELELKSLDSSLNTRSENIEKLEKIQEYFNSVVEHRVNETMEKLKEVINTGIFYIFGDEIKIDIESKVKNNKTVFELSVIHGDISGLAEIHGGGVLSVISVLFKISILTLEKHRRFIVLDETLSAVSIEYQDKLSEFLKKLADKLDFTILLISHQPELSRASDVTYKTSSSGFTEVVK